MSFERNVNALLFGSYKSVDEAGLPKLLATNYVEIIKLQVGPHAVYKHICYGTSLPTDSADLDAVPVGSEYWQIALSTDGWSIASITIYDMTADGWVARSSGAALVKAAGSDITTGTEDTKYVTSKALADAGVNVPPSKVQAINAQTGTTYGLVLADAFKLVTLNNADSILVTVPAHTTQAFPVGASIDLLQLGVGAVTLTSAGGVTINSKSGNKTLAAQCVGATLIKVATDSWVLLGDLVA